MKKRFNTISLVFMICLVLYGCNKKSTPAPPVTKTQWTYGGVTFIGATTTIFADFELVAYSAPANGVITSIGIQFGGNPTAGNYNVVSPVAAVVNADQCYIVENQDGGLKSASGGTVTVTTANGIITAKFNNILMSTETGFSVNTGYSFAPAGNLSGTIIQQ